MKRGARVLVGGGIAGLLLGSLVGGLRTGYELETGGFLIRVGLVYLLFGAVLWRVGLSEVPEAVGVSVGTFTIVYLTGVVLMYNYFFITPPEFARQPAVSTLLTTQAEYSLALAPVSTGYLVGILIRRDAMRAKLAGVGTLLLTAVVGWALASSVAATGQPGFAFILLALLAGAATVAAVVPIAVILRAGRE